MTIEDDAKHNVLICPASKEAQSDQGHREIFKTRAVCFGPRCSLIIDGKSSINMVSERFVLEDEVEEGVDLEALFNLMGWT